MSLLMALLLSATVVAAQTPPVPATTSVSAAAAEEPPVWRTLDEAMREAAARKALIVFAVESDDYQRDRDARSWLTSAEQRESIAQSLRQLVLARGTVRDAAIERLPALAAHLARGGRQSAARIIVLDPSGGIVHEPVTAFGDLTRFAWELNSLRQQTDAFVAAAELRERGQLLESKMVRADALLSASLYVPAIAAFEEVESAAARAKDEGLRQFAQLSLATIESRRGGRYAAAALRTAERIAEHGANRDVAAAAWLMLGHMRRNGGNTRGALQAYQRAYEVALKPSPTADAARQVLEGLGSAPESEVRKASAQGAVNLLYPHRDVLVGKVDFVAAVPSHTARVEMFLDDIRVEELTAAPFRARIMLGNSPRVHVVRAVAYDQQNAIIGERSVTINGVAQSLGVTITEPRDTSVASSTIIVVTPRLPATRELAGVDLYWNQQKLTTLTAPPFRHELTLPSPSAAGYIRAVIRDTSGATAEDVKLLNSGGSSAEMRVDAVQLHALVQDRKGMYVEGLTARDFLVQEDGRTVEPQIQSTASDPIAVGLALDTSSSMQLAMIEVVEYANLFVKQSLSEGDQTFAVAFNQAPQLVQPLTADRRQVSASIYDMRSQGGTALWDALLFSLQQFHDVRGKRALVVFTDGDNTGGSATPAATMQYAREVGVPVYVVQILSAPKTKIVVANGRRMIAAAAEPNGTDALRKLAEATGGALFRLTRKEDLARIFAQIRDDTRGEYLLSYVSPSSKPAGQLRKISITVPKRDVTVRAMTGYYPR